MSSRLSRYRPRGIVQSRGEGELEFGRVVAFSDGVIAIAITLMVLTLVFLALIVVMPFATDLVAEYDDDPVCIVVYASVVGLASLMTWLMIRYSLASGHVRAPMRPLAAAGGRRGSRSARRSPSSSRRRWRCSRPARPSRSGWSRSCSRARGCDRVPRARVSGR